jgi:hypothetical protein
MSHPTENAPSERFEIILPLMGNNIIYRACEQLKNRKSISSLFQQVFDKHPVHRSLDLRQWITDYHQIADSINLPKVSNELIQLFAGKYFNPNPDYAFVTPATYQNLFQKAVSVHKRLIYFMCLPAVGFFRGGVPEIHQWLLRWLIAWCENRQLDFLDFFNDILGEIITGDFQISQHARSEIQPLFEGRFPSNQIRRLELPPQWERKLLKELVHVSFDESQHEQIKQRIATLSDDDLDLQASWVLKQFIQHMFQEVKADNFVDLVFQELAVRIQNWPKSGGANENYTTNPYQSPGREPEAFASTWDPDFDVSIVVCLEGRNCICQHWDVAFGCLWAFLQDAIYWTLFTANRIGWLTPNRWQEIIAGLNVSEIPWREIAEGDHSDSQRKVYELYIKRELERYQASRNAFKECHFPEGKNFPNSNRTLGDEYVFEVSFSQPNISLKIWDELVRLFERSLWKFVRGIEEWQGSGPCSDIPIGITAFLPNENPVQKFHFFTSALLDGEISDLDAKTSDWLNKWLGYLEAEKDLKLSRYNGTGNVFSLSISVPFRAAPYKAEIQLSHH